ncbi:MGDG synthase family glycosyltransferase [Undibacterium flavidum]|uniref:Galactosyldiacylglycerol synthase n=1 Tax=Undibacterium flavidum TaxID=2762297 RepID=A0ABR6YGD9_9BURK|nr:glycosyltransferase [Undibacterium flavidum]MBC3875646.1 galactosyldiacylglycerol synthase [Undibacterium flavidum]
MADNTQHSGKKILLLSVSAGAGHARAAEAIRAYAAIADPASTVIHLDVMDYVTSGFRQIYTDFYLKLVNHAPTLWGYLYNFTNEVKRDSSIEKWRRGLERWNAKKLLREIQSFQADAIICTHFLPAEMLSRLIARQELNCPVWVQVTDFDLHRMWIHEGMAGYFAANQEVAFRMRSQGIAAERIHVTGIPIMPAFAQAPTRAICASEFGLDPSKLTIMLMAGGAGLGQLDQLAAQLLQMRFEQMDEAIPFQLIVLCGKNTKALQALQNLALTCPRRLFPIGFTSQVERLMACADLIVTKPGGLTTSECLAMALPMIVNAPIPGQEERNADYVMEQGAALKAIDNLALEFRIRELIAHPQRLNTMREQARRLGKANAAQSVFDIVSANL